MSRITSRTTPSTATRVRGAPVVISPATTARSVVTSVSQATRLIGSCFRQKSRIASLIWSATLSGWPIDTDSLVKRYRSALTVCTLRGCSGHHKFHCVDCMTGDALRLEDCQQRKQRGVGSLLALRGMVMSHVVWDALTTHSDAFH